jgi:hypothetical protein
MEGPLIAARKTLTRSARPSCKLPFHPGQPRGDVRQHHQFANTIKLMLPSKRSVSVRDKGFGSQLCEGK